VSDFHYVRTLGDDGGVDIAPGAAIGLDLESVLRDGLPPYNVVLQILAGVCEILDIAEEDGRVHGDIQLGHVFVDDTGAVSLEGFDQRRTRAPEGRPDGPVTDLYGLGAIGYELFAGHPLPDVDRRHADDHDDDVIDAILALSFGDLNEEMVGDVQWFLAKLLSFDPVDRPSAVETWRTFIAFAEEARGPEFVGWCLDALDGLGERRAPDGSVLPSAGPSEAPSGTGDLGGPVVSRGPLDQIGLFKNSPTPAGGTAFFNKADMKAALAKAPAESPRDRQPAVGGGSATNYWSRDQLKAMAAGDQEAPRPKRAAGEGQRRRTMATTKADLDKARKREAEAVRRIPAAPPVPRPSHAPEVASPPDLASQPLDVKPFAQSFAEEPEGGEQTVRMSVNDIRTTNPTPAPPPQVYRPPTAQPRPAEPEPAAKAQGPTKHLEDADRVIAQALKEGRQNPPRVPQGGSLPVEPPVPPYEPEDYDEDDDAGSSTNLILIAGIALILVIAIVLCLGLGGISAVLAVFSGGTTAPTEVAPTTEEPVPALDLPLPDPDGPAPEPGPDTPAEPVPVAADPTPAPTPKPTRPEPAPVRPPPRPQPTRPAPEPTRPRPSGGGFPPPGPVGRTPAAPDPEPPSPSDGPARLTFSSRDRGKIACGSKRKSFDGQQTFTFEPYALPVTCVVQIEGADPEAFQVFATGSVACSAKDGKVVCSKAVVR
jgi:hypothetical protein